MDVPYCIHRELITGFTVAESAFGYKQDVTDNKEPCIMTKHLETRATKYAQSNNEGGVQQLQHGKKQQWNEDEVSASLFMHDELFDWW